MKYVRLYSDPAGQSHFAESEIEFTNYNFNTPIQPVLISANSPATQCAFCLFPAGWQGDWHPVPCRRFFYFLSGEAVTEVSDGEVRHFTPGSAVLVEDTTGVGHITRVVSQTDVLTAIVQLPD